MEAAARDPVAGRPQPGVRMTVGDQDRDGAVVMNGAGRRQPERLQARWGGLVDHQPREQVPVVELEAAVMPGQMSTPSGHPRHGRPGVPQAPSQF